jgi:hypothetical protein
VIFFLFWCGQGRKSLLGLFLATFGVVFFLFWCVQRRTFFVGALFDHFWCGLLSLPHSTVEWMASLHDLRGGGNLCGYTW